MFGLKSKAHQELLMRYRTLELEYKRLQDIQEARLRDHNALIDRWNSLVRHVNATANTCTQPHLSQEDIKRLIVLVHPDKHGGKPLAVEMTQRLLQLRGN